jgi:propionate catabolism operon transcriptional regulator
MEANQARPKIWAVVTLGRLDDLYREVVPEFQEAADIRVVSLPVDEAVRAIEGAEPGQLDVAVSAGANGAYIRSKVAVPISLITVRGFDMLHALTTASHYADSVAVVAHHVALPPLDRYKAAFRLDVSQWTYRNAREAEDCVLEARDRGIRVVIGSGHVMDLADKLGLQGIYIYTYDSVRTAFQGALEIARARQAEAQKREGLKTMLRHLRDGVIAVNTEGTVLAVNPVITSILSRPEHAMVGRSLSEVAPGFANGDAPGPEDEQRIQVLGGNTYVVRSAPMVEHGVPVGALVTFVESQTLQRIARDLRTTNRPKQVVAKYQLSDLAGASPALVRLREQASRYAQTEATILVTGESGTGKELLAQGIHNASARSGGPFVAVNCGAFPETLLESELFGYEEGAFTGARRGGKPGLIELAHRGTLFLDEIGEMPLALQTRLLRVLQEKEVLRLGARGPTAVDVRVIAATHRPLEQSVERQLFRADLYYRLDILRLEVPPLRARPEDVLPLATMLLDRVLRRSDVHGDALGLLARIGEVLRGYHWPGNVRQLENVVERLGAYVALGNVTAEDVPGILREAAPELFRVAMTPAETVPFRNMTLAQQARLARRTLEEAGGDRDEACRRLGISRSTLWRKLRASHGVS